MTNPQETRAHQEAERLVRSIKNSLAYTMIPSEHEDIYSLILTALTRTRQAAFEEAAKLAELHRQSPGTTKIQSYATRHYEAERCCGVEIAAALRAQRTP